MKRTVAGLMLASLGACGQASTEPGGPPAELHALPRPLSASEQQLIDASNDFAFSFFRQIGNAPPSANVFVSPLSASLALGMTMNGAASSTFDAMRTTLGFGAMPNDAINAGYHDLIALLESLDPSTQLGVANSIWYAQGFAVNSSFLNSTRSAFGAEVQSLDFGNGPAALGAVNGWVNTQTRGRIPSILDSIDMSAVMYLINAIYFKGNWRLRFDSTQTRDASFHAADGVSRNVRLMHTEDTLLYLETPAFQAADLAYGNGAFRMTILMPKAGTNIDDFAASLSRTDWNGWMQNFHTQKIILELPRFTLAYKRRLNDDLKAMGMGIAFDPLRADFSRIASVGPDRLFISTVVQKAFVAVDEVGTEAAAVTAVGVSVTSLPVVPTMRVDRPFVFAIRERLSGTILFMGKITTLPVS
jgi:serine protease inhibitor